LTQEILNESRLIFEDNCHLGVLISLEINQKTTSSLADSTTFQKILSTKLSEFINLMKVLTKIATDSEKLMNEISQCFENVFDIYFHFNATHGAGEITLEK